MCVHESDRGIATMAVVTDRLDHVRTILRGAAVCRESPSNGAYALAVTFQNVSQQPPALLVA